MRTFCTALIAGMVFVAGGPVACETDNNRDIQAGNTSIDIRSEQSEVFVGDTVTFVAKTADTYGRDAKVVWASPAGDIDTNEEGRVARVKFTQEGTYSVRATLEIDGRAVHSDVVEVRVKPVR